MALSRMTDRSVDARIDAKAVAQAALLGSLADDVLEALIWDDAGKRELATSSAIIRAASLFEQAAAQAEAPVTLWQRNDAPTVLRRMAMSQVLDDVPTTGGSTADTRPQELLRRIADALKNVAAGSASKAEREILRGYFEAMSNATIESATELARARRSNPPWSTI